MRRTVKLKKDADEKRKNAGKIRKDTGKKSEAAVVVGGQSRPGLIPWTPPPTQMPPKEIGPVDWQRPKNNKRG